MTKNPRSQNVVSTIRNPEPFENWPLEAKAFATDRTIEQSTIEACGWGFATATVAYAHVGHQKSGIVMPRHDLDGEIVDYVIRVIPSKSSGPKYLMRSGARNRFLYPQVVPDWRSIANDPRREVSFVEGLGNAARLAQDGIVVIGINGVFGHLSDGDPLPDYAEWIWQGRKVRLYVDSDWETKHGVRDGWIRHTDELARRGASVLVVPLPTLPGQRKTGPDDYLSAKSAKALLALPAYPSTDPRFDEWRTHPLVAEFNKRYAVLQIQGKALIAQTDEEEVTFYKKADFLILHENRLVEVGKHADGRPIRVSAGKFWLGHPDRRQLRTVTMLPEGPQDGRDLNMWRGWAIEPKRGEWSLFRTHIHEVICNGDRKLSTWLTAWLAARVQHPAKPAQVAVVLRGEEGIGKSFLAHHFGRLYGSHYLQVSQTRHLVGHFNKHLMGKLLVFADEAYFAGDRSHRGSLYALVTEPFLNIELKGVDVLSIPNYVALIMASNEDWVIPASLDARRFAVFEVSSKRKEQRDYFAAIAAQLEAGGYAAMMYDLLRFDLSKSDPWRAPRTAGLTRQKIHALAPPQQFWFEALQRGELVNEAWPAEVSKGRLGVQFFNWLSTTRAETRELRSAQTALGAAIKRLCPSAREGRPAKGGTRERVWELPNLATARREFEAAIQGRIDWHTGEPS